MEPRSALHSVQSFCQHCFLVCQVGTLQLHLDPEHQRWAGQMRRQAQVYQGLGRSAPDSTETAQLTQHLQLPPHLAHRRVLPLHRGHRQLLAGYLPEHLGLDVRRFLADMQTALGPLIASRPGEDPPFDPTSAPRMHLG